MSASLRIPTHSDYEQIASWIVDAAACRRWAGPRVPFPFSPSELPQLLTLEDGASFCLAQNDTVPLAFGQYLPRPNNVVHLMRLIVSPERRGEGWGRELCVQLTARAVAATDAESVTLKVYADNLAAVSLYESLGFHRDASEHGGDSFLMRMPVSDRKASRALRFAILGNSGSGKSTLALSLANRHAIPLLDLDTVAWAPGKVGVPRDPNEAAVDIRTFCSLNEAFVIEGCYEDLIAASLDYLPRLIFLDFPAEVCEKHCRERPFEPHKYASLEAQNEKLEFLLQWVRDYYTRAGRMSRAEHLKLFDSYAGPKARYVSEFTHGI